MELKKYSSEEIKLELESYLNNTEYNIVYINYEKEFGIKIVKEGKSFFGENENKKLKKEDFNDFLHNCKSEWENYFYSKITKEIHEYSEKELNELGFNIFTYIINGLKIKFKYDISFDIENVYVKNGSFLKLSNIENGFPTNSLISLSIFKSLYEML